MMKLLDILARNLKAWPERVHSLSQMRNGYIINGSGFDGVAFDCLEIAEETLIAGAIVTLEQWQAAVDALDTPKTAEWTGEGLPPVGTVCEYQCGYVEQRHAECKVIAHFTGESGKTLAAFTYVARDGVVMLGRGAPALFRPIRTAEQIAAEEHDAAISEMISACAYPGSNITRHVCEEIYALGYRKQVTS